MALDWKRAFISSNLESFEKSFKTVFSPYFCLIVSSQRPNSSIKPMDLAFLPVTTSAEKI